MLPPEDFAMSKTFDEKLMDLLSEHLKDVKMFTEESKLLYEEAVDALQKQFFCVATVALHNAAPKDKHVFRILSSKFGHTVVGSFKDFARKYEKNVYDH